MHNSITVRMRQTNITAMELTPCLQTTLSAIRYREMDYSENTFCMNSPSLDQWYVVRDFGLITRPSNTKKEIGLGLRPGHAAVILVLVLVL